MKRFVARAALILTGCMATAPALAITAPPGLSNKSFHVEANFGDSLFGNAVFNFTIPYYGPNRVVGGVETPYWDTSVGYTPFKKAPNFTYDENGGTKITVGYGREIVLGVGPEAGDFVDVLLDDIQLAFFYAKDGSGLLGNRIGVGYTIASETRMVNGQLVSTPHYAAGTITEVGSFVPEPASWAMMIAGIGIAGAGLRRRPRMAYA